MSKIYRIKDIAQMAGVSTGTVDRILHKRGKVSIEAQQKVEKVLKEIDYHPNLIARSLALKKNYRFLTVMPSFKEGEYWADVNRGIEKAEQELFSYNVEVDHLYFDQYDKRSFDSLLTLFHETECQGVVIATLFKESVLALTSFLDEKEIPYVLIDSFINGTNSIAYYGTHSYDSGYIAGRLLCGQISLQEDIVVFRFIRQGDFSSTQVANREEGFRNYLYSHGFEGKIYPLLIHSEDNSHNQKVLRDFFDAHPQVRNGIIFNSRAHLLGDYLTKMGKNNDFRLIGYDVLEANVSYLKEGLITHLIAQRPEVQGLNAIKAIFRHLVLEEKIDLINYMPIDVLIKENISYYNNYI